MFDNSNMRDAHDDDDFTFETLAAVTARVLGVTNDNKQNEDAGRDLDRQNTKEENAKQHRRYVEQRLRELAAFERRARGGK